MPLTLHETNLTRPTITL